MSFKTGATSSSMTAEGKGTLKERLFGSTSSHLMAGMAQMKSALGGIPVFRAMITDFRTLAPDDPLSHAVDQILAGSQQDFPVVEDGQVVGILTRQDLLTGLTQRGQQTPVREFMQRDFQTVQASEMLELAFQRFQTCQCHTLPVLHHGELTGLVTMDNVGEFVAIQAAIETAQPRLG